MVVRFCIYFCRMTDWMWSEKEMKINFKFGRPEHLEGWYCHQVTRERLRWRRFGEKRSSVWKLYV